MACKHKNTKKGHMWGIKVLPVKVCMDCNETEAIWHFIFEPVFAFGWMFFSHVGYFPIKLEDHE